jgi:Spy/CpxP family protein refolding chaperone
MNSPSPRNEQLIAQDTARSRSRRLMIAGASAVLVSALSFAGVSDAQEAQAPQKVRQERHGHHGKMNPEQAEKRVERMLNRLVPDATPEQKTKLIAIAKAAFNDLHPLREKSREAHAQGMRLLAQPDIDRNALEQVRQTEQTLADQRSRRVTQAFADAAEVLTPAQRVAAAEKMAKHHGHHGFHRDHRDHDGHRGHDGDAAK